MFSKETQSAQKTQKDAETANGYSTMVLANSRFEEVTLSCFFLSVFPVNAVSNFSRRLAAATACPTLNS